MAHPQPERYISLDEYYEILLGGKVKYEWFNGQMWPVGNPTNSPKLMAGAQPDHNRIKNNVETRLTTQLENTNCEVMSGDQQIRVEDTNLIAFPDVVVVCQDAQFEDVRGLGTLLNPVVLVEILFPSTEAYDRTDKWAHYQRLASLRDYLVVFSDQMCIEHHSRKRQSDPWTEAIWFRADDQIQLKGIPATLRVSDLYRRVHLSSVNTTRCRASIWANNPTLASMTHANANRWFLLQLETAPETVEDATAFMHSLEAQGVQIEDTQILFDQSEDATLVPREKPLVTGFFEIQSPAHLEDLRAVTNELPFEATARWEEIETQDWATKWRENFPPLHIGPFLVVPTWEETPAAEGEIILRLDPGLAFGTGQHPTTHLCLELLAQQLKDKPNISLLDVGCGSGILSLAAAKLGAHVVASDLDLWCVEATKENAEINGVTPNIEARLVADLDWVKSPFPFVIANLMSDLLIRLSGDLARATESGGTLIVSGISAPRADDVQAALERAGFSVQEKRERDGETRGDGWTERWSAFVFTRN